MKRHSVFDACNHTELYQICVDAGITVRPNEPREKMIEYLEGESESPYHEEENVFHSWRWGIIRFLNNYRKKLETQITCPAKALWDPVNPNPKPCFGCLDVQVVTCIVMNSGNESKIAEFREVRRSEEKWPQK